MVRTVPLIIISGLGGVLCYLIPKRRHIAEKTALAVLLGGALSNLYDRYARRYVVDYLNVRAGALEKVVFNLGDLFVFLGAGALLIIKGISSAVRRFQRILRRSSRQDSPM